MQYKSIRHRNEYQHWWRRNARGRYRRRKEDLEISGIIRIGGFVSQQTSINAYGIAVSIL